MARNPLIDKLHELMVAELTSRLTDGEEKITGEGEVVKLAACPATLAVIAKFLKDNHVEVGAKNPKVNALAEHLSKVTDNLEDYELH